MSKIVLASNNSGKINEFNRLLKPFQWEVISQGSMGVESVPEDGLSFVENALIKARHASRTTGLPALADDSGLVVDALQGAPGIYSARYAGQDATDQENNNKLLQALEDLPAAQRTAHFHCTLVWMQHAEDPDPIICQGHWYGTILTKPTGTKGFGYDPLFWVEQEQCSSAELTPERKNTLSHRGRAVSELLQTLQERHG
ncbi:RdgB/HAM1 family non-canonical purine NTP pyrophosphatase [Hahella ganghwensis]|uniref:RdgB/HAM1 family non-canonical purine NTP pyrophosphatase n=1 Tax=Hahella ganghwensis TaxID=286420 RepID=UPI0003697BEA|nr:RdgB/HAM1 family non-canonical purine NTP pyrophosphatase [Hahella ganghwensis]